MGIFDFLKSKEQKQEQKQEIINTDDKFTLYDTYLNEHHARTDAKMLKRTGRTTKIKEKNNEWQLWCKV